MRNAYELGAFFQRSTICLKVDATVGAVWHIVDLRALPLSEHDERQHGRMMVSHRNDNAITFADVPFAPRLRDEVDAASRVGCEDDLVFTSTDETLELRTSFAKLGCGMRRQFVRSAIYVRIPMLVEIALCLQCCTQPLRCCGGIHVDKLASMFLIVQEREIKLASTCELISPGNVVLGVVGHARYQHVFGNIHKHFVRAIKWLRLIRMGERLLGNLNSLERRHAAS